MKKPFDLEYYLEHPETKVVTRGGTSGHAKNARIISTDTKSINGYIITALIPTGAQGSENAYSFDKHGRYMGNTIKNELDLFFDLPDPEKKRVPLTYTDLLDRVKSGKTMWLINDRDTVCNIVDFDFVDAFYINGDAEEIIRVSYEELMDGITFVDGDPCWKEVDG